MALLLKPHQQKIIDKAPNKHGIFFRPRTGKTPTAIRLASSRAKRCLVVLPKHILEQWQSEIEKWREGDCEFIVTTKERFRIDHIKEIKKRGKGQTLIFSDKWPACDMVIVDEVHRQGSNYKNKFHKCLLEYITRHKVPYVYLLSGTPWNKNPDSVYSYGLLLGQKWDFWMWRSKFYIRIKMGMREFFKPNEKEFPTLVRILDQLGTTVRLEDITGVIEDEETFEYFDLTPEQNKAIENITDMVPVARYSKLHQIEQGVLKGNQFTPGELFKNNKDERILELAEEEDKIIIICRYLDQMNQYKKILEKEGHFVALIHGKMKEEVKNFCQMLNEKEKAVVIVQSQKSDGFDLKGFDTMIFASMSYSFVDWDQMTQRMKSMTKGVGCHYIYLLSRGKTVDKAIYDSVKKGEDFNDKLFNKNIC